MIDLFRKLKEILSPKDRVKLVILFFMMVVGGVVEVFSISVVAAFVSVVADPSILFNIEILSPVLEFFGIEDARGVLLYGSAFLIIVFVLKNAYVVFYKYLLARFVHNRYRALSTRLFNVYMNTPYAFHLRRNSADLIRNVSQEVKHIASNVMMPGLKMATEAVMIISISLLLLIVEPVVTVFAVIFLGGTSFIILRIIRSRMDYYGKEALNERAGMIKAVNEGVGGLKDITVMNRQGWFMDRFYKSADMLARSYIFRDLIKNSVRPVLETIAVTGMLVIAIVLMWEGRSIASLASVLAMFALSIQRLLPAVNELVSGYNMLFYHSYAVYPVHEDLMSFKKKKEKEEAEEMSFKEKIEMRNVSYAYPHTEENVLRNASLVIEKGSAVGIVGATGSGKTTAVDIVLGLLDPQEGSIEVDGEDIKNNLRGWQKKIGYIPQSIYLSDDTVRNNIAFGVPEEEIDEERVERAVEAAQLKDFISRLPEGISTLIGERGVRLSGGQKQRIGIARALYNEPEVLVMDEATSSLDNVTERFVINAIERLKEGRTLIIIAHRLTTVKKCDKLYIIKGGEVVAEGSYDDLMEKNEDFRSMNIKS